MKNYLKAHKALFFGIIALAAVIGISITGCVVEPTDAENNPANTTETSPHALTAGAWFNGALREEKSKIWFSFPVTINTSYEVYQQDKYNSSKTCDIGVSIKYAGASNWIEGNSAWGWENANPNTATTPYTFTASQSGTVLLLVQEALIPLPPTGTFGIKFEQGTAPALVMSGTVTITGEYSVIQTGDVLTAELTGGPTGATPIYQWKKDGVDVGTDSNTYETTAPGAYTVVVTADGYTGSVTSAAVNVYDAGTEQAPYWLDGFEEWFEGDVTAKGTTASDVTTGAIWFAFDVENGKTYTVWWDDSYLEGSGTCDADICVAAKYQGDASITIFGMGPASQNGSSSSNRGVDIGYPNAARPNSTFTANKDGVVLVRVLAETAGDFGAIPGTFGITWTEGTDGPGGGGPYPSIVFPVVYQSLNQIKE